MYTNDDYFKHESYGYGYSESQADWQAQVDIDEISDRFNHFLKWQGCEQTRYSDWYYSCQCHGLDAGPTGYSDWWNLRPTKIEPSDMQWWCDYDFMRCWQRHYYRLCWIADAMERYEELRDSFDNFCSSPYGITIRYAVNDETGDVVVLSFSSRVTPHETMAFPAEEVGGNYSSMTEIEAWHDDSPDFARYASEIGCTLVADEDSVNETLYARYDRLYTTFLDMYEEAYSDAIEELCHTAERLFNDVCDYAYSDEAAEEWCKFQNAELEYQEEQERIRKAKEADERRERDFENMVGMTATDDSYTV